LCACSAGYVKKEASKTENKEGKMKNSNLPIDPNIRFDEVFDDGDKDNNRNF
jgi:hypothetical protein